MKVRFAKVGVNKLKLPLQTSDLNLTEHLYDEIEHRLHARFSQATSVLDLTNALLAEWAEIPLQNLVESLVRRLVDIIVGCYSSNFLLVNE